MPSFFSDAHLPKIGKVKVVRELRSRGTGSTSGYKITQRWRILNFLFDGVKLTANIKPVL